MLMIEDYKELFDSCEVTTDITKMIQIRTVCKTLLENHVTYWGVEQSTGIPWIAIALIHYRESSQSFKCHLHNGDPLDMRTIHVPKGRPENGNPPFTWTQSAVDALSDREHPYDWNLYSVLEFCEHYNGLGYQKRGILSPYIWSFTNKYMGGLFVADGSFDLEKKDARPGCAAILKTLFMMGVELDFRAGSVESDTLH